jgi:hypothetical protein
VRSPQFSETAVRAGIEVATSSVVDALPGHGMYRQDVVAAYGWWTLILADRMARLVGRKATTAALRRLADAVEADRLADLSKEIVR